MTRTKPRSRTMHVAAAALATAALGGGLLATPSVAGAGPQGLKVVPLVADRAGHAPVVDKNLVNPWGLADAPGVPLWVADNGVDVATLYTGAIAGAPVTPVPLVVSITGGAPSGQVFNAGNGFQVTDGHTWAPAKFLFSSESGDITGWSPMVSGTVAQRRVHVPDAVFKGLTMAMVNGHARIYATDFHNGRVDVWNDHFMPVNVPGAFMDPMLPAGYAPFNVQLLNGNLYVTYAVQNAARHDDSAGPGHGIVDVYSTSGMFLRRLVSHGLLDSPWGLAIAPRSFGPFAGALLVGNFGDGHIDAYNPMTGQSMGPLTDSAGHALWIDGLWALRTGSNVFGGPGSIEFSAGSDHEAHGLLGVIRP